jgi:DmsE family decaheme c-type cytochrome
LLLAVSGFTSPRDEGAAPMRSDQFEECATCHEEHAQEFLLTPHSALESEGLAKKVGAESSCTACHGDPTTHLDEGGGQGNIFAFGEDELPSARSASCLGCHATQHPRFAATSHAKAGLDCTSCHGIHGDPWSLIDAPKQIRSELQGSRTSDACTECHNDIFAQFEFNERHRLQEGILECTSCHNPHEPPQRWMLGGFKQEACATCHADKSGPWVFEHGSVRGEGCTSCHNPHGSPNRHLLAFQNVAELCYSCHIEVPGFHSRFTLESQCTNCHSSIHGSHIDPFFLQ